MPKTKISEYSTTNSANTDIESINIDEGCAPSGINNAIRELMVHLKEFQTGASGDAFTFAGGVLISGTANTITGNVLMSGTNTITGSTTATFAAGAVGTPSIAAHGDTNTGIFFPAADTVAFTEGGAEAMRIDSSGRVGIGTTSPSNKLAVSNGGANGFEVAPGSTSTTILSYNRSTDVYTDVLLYGGNLIFNTAPAGSSTERMRIDSSGNVLVGTTTAYYASSGRGLVEINGSSNAMLGLIVGGTGKGFLYHTGTDMWLKNSANGTLTFYTNDTERARITSGGAFFIGTTDDSVAGNSNGVFVSAGSLIVARQEADICAVFRRWSTNGSIIEFRNTGNTAVGTISTSASATAYNTSSDYRLKENIAPMTGALEVVAQLKPVTYTWKVDGSAGQGFIAHELQSVVPDAVAGEKDATEMRQVEVSPAVYEDVVIPAVLDDDGNEVEPERTEKQLVSEAVYEEQEVPVYQGVDTSFLVATLTAAIQELSAKNDALEARLAALESK